MNSVTFEPGSALRLRRLGIGFYREFAVYMNRDCEACRSEGFEVRSRRSEAERILA